MELTVLVDNNTLTDRYFYGEPGLSFFIEENGKRILFDVGYSDVFLKNAGKMGINLLDLDLVFLSHGHLDHTWGLVPLISHYTEAIVENRAYRRPRLVAHPAVLASKSVDGLKEIGSILTEEKLKLHFELDFRKEPFWLTDKLVFLGEIERINDFEAKGPLGKVVLDNSENDDYLLDDTALAYKSDAGLVVITGCSHAGICNIIEQAKKVCGEQYVLDVIGGFHLLNPSPKQLQGTVNYMERLKPKLLHPCHCTDWNSKLALSKVATLNEVGVGLTLKY